MGLDITAVSHAEYIETMDSVEKWEDKYDHRDDNIIFASHWIPAYADRAIPIIENGVYKVNGVRFDFRAGSYSGYGEWRDWLSRTMSNVPARYIWEHERAYARTPFYELINFSDCEGIIGTYVAKKLAFSFATYQDIAIAHGQEYDGWFADKYTEWRKAFELAADNGFVIFH